MVSLLVLASCKKDEGPPDANQAAIRLEVSFDFKAGCIITQVRDKADASKSLTGEQLVWERAERKAVFGIFRREEWGRTLEVISTAHERDCKGQEVARKTQEVTLDTPGVQTFSFALSAVDTDGDGYVPTSGGGTDCVDNDAAVRQLSFYRDGDGDGVGGGDVVLGCTAPAQHVAQSGDCDDGNAERRPGNQEICDGVDNDCVEGIDNGLTLNSYYLDSDRDGVGAGPVVRACVAPENHVASSNDCDDNDAARKPGLAETCDDKDNNCDNRTDEGLAVVRYYRDADGDGFGTMTDTRLKCNRPEGYVSSNVDCNDSNSAVNPSAQEVCNEVDDNCSGGTDEGFNKTWHRDADGDNYGLANTTMTGCMQPAGYVAPTAVFDCNDAEAAVNPGVPEKCNGVDDNCVNGEDEPFKSGPTRLGATCGASCPGIYVCNEAQDDTRCNAPTGTTYYTPDVDGDGDALSGAQAQVACSPTMPPAGSATSNTDCDDTDRYNRGGGTEVCDFRDNNCNVNSDEGNVCMGAGWNPVTDSALNGRDWNTVAISKASVSGYPVWIAGANGALARRNAANESFTSFDGQCGATTTWNAAWVSSDGSVFLAGSGGQVARHDGTGCSMQHTLTGAHNATGIVGFEDSGMTLYVVDEGGQLHSWATSGAPVRAADSPTNPAPLYRDAHGFDRTRLFIVGQESNGQSVPQLETYSGGATPSDVDLPTGGSPSNSSLRSVWMVSPTLAYAVGDNNLVMRWQGAGWSLVTPPANTNFTSVCAPDRSSVYVTDAAGRIHRHNGLGNTWVTQYTPPTAGPLRDIALVSPTNIWAVGPGGRVIHFPQLP
ncbi:hypothetical protein HPC49_05820 [Pyxidicoccus fallax]|uniref:Uncharacterized protein n=1 Tax=Pyxidicoccus fallax TaxID=394095 RepID=A0A848L9A2_9BACT|nr:putative metal-binding motif-containing protein [Pyxidicoccus fallax]NMO15147.1 hypothetical protein [Pyxidicoccus fallax]NPC77769.1 hypothetical protein [Pyxidicoccus fallax]